MEEIILQNHRPGFFTNRHKFLLLLFFFNKNDKFMWIKRPLIEMSAQSNLWLFLDPNLNRTTRKPGFGNEGTGLALVFLICADGVSSPQRCWVHMPFGAGIYTGCMAMSSGAPGRKT
jgi:hypothetical protein